MDYAGFLAVVAEGPQEHQYGRIRLQMLLFGSNSGDVLGLLAVGAAKMGAYGLSGFRVLGSTVGLGGCLGEGERGWFGFRGLRAEGLQAASHSQLIARVWAQEGV